MTIWIYTHVITYELCFSLYFCILNIRKTDFIIFDYLCGNNEGNRKDFLTCKIIEVDGNNTMMSDVVREFLICK